MGDFHQLKCVGDHPIYQERVEETINNANAKAINQLEDLIEIQTEETAERDNNLPDAEECDNEDDTFEAINDIKAQATTNPLKLIN